MSSPDKGQTEPLAALVAAFALGVGLSLYVGVLDSTLPSLTVESEMAPIAADRFVEEASALGVVRPPIGDAVDAASPNGYATNATLRSDLSLSARQIDEDTGHTGVGEWRTRRYV